MRLATILLAMSLIQLTTTGKAAIELVYRGTVSQVTRGKEIPTKSFRVVAFLSDRISYIVEEDGIAGGWPWPARFGTVADGKPIRLLHEHDGSRYPIALPDPAFREPSRLVSGETWKDKNRQFSVHGSKKISGRNCREVRVVADRGLRQTIWFDQSNHQLVSAEQRFFMGRGDEFQLKMQIESSRQIDDDELLKVDNAMTALLKLQADLKRSPDEHRPELSATQIKTINERIAGIEKLASDTSIQSLTVDIRRDIKLQVKRQSELASLGKNLLGKSAPKFELTKLNGEVISRIANGKPVVLHFWTYNGDVLEEPYGQVGYLDFMNTKLKQDGVNVYGVAVDARIAKADERKKAIRSIKKMRDFMNLSYEVTADDGSILDRFGDPRAVGAKLPLWVVIDAEGKVAHYHAGFHKVDRRQGLTALGDSISESK